MGENNFDKVSAGLPELVRVPAKGEEIELTGLGACKVRSQHREPAPRA